MSALPRHALPLFSRLFPLSPLNRRLLAVGCELSCRLTPLFATLAGSLQTAENIATLSPFPATLTSHVKHKSFVCHSYKKQGGWGTLSKYSPSCLASPLFSARLRALCVFALSFLLCGARPSQANDCRLTTVPSLPSLSTFNFQLSTFITGYRSGFTSHRPRITGHGPRPHEPANL